MSVDARGWGWRHAGRASWALRGVDLRIERGERVLLLGASGAGKSTLLRGLAGLLDRSGGGDSEGMLLVEGAAPDRARGSTGLVFQDPDAQIVMGTVGDEIAFGLENRCVPRDEIWHRVTAALAAVRVGKAPTDPTDALSGGEKQRLALASVLAMRPALLLLDEPTANLDPDGAAAFVAALRDVLTGSDTTLLLVEHRIELALGLVDRVVVLDGARGVVADGSPSAIVRDHGADIAALGAWLPEVRDVAAPRTRRTTAGTALVHASDVRYRYPDAPAEALGGVDAALHAAEALALIGPNGSGKSTLALLLGGLLAPTAGSVLAGDQLRPRSATAELCRWSARELVARAGNVFQNPAHQFLTGRVRDELALGPRRAGAKDAEADARAGELLERLALAPLADANPHTLSGGEQRRLSVGTALATRPAVIVLDEPTFGLDRRAHGELLALLSGLSDSGTAICFATHDALLVEALADRTLTLRSGREA